MSSTGTDDTRCTYPRGVSTPMRYVSSDEDSGRWLGFPFRAGDIVISTRSKHGTTWTQQICALLVHGPQLPDRLGRLSPWLDHLLEPRDAVIARLEAQPGRRVIKTHTPLDGVPADPRVHYVVVARHPLDAAVSLYHQSANLDRERLRALTGAPEPSGPAAPRPALRDWLLDWIEEPTPDPRAALDSLDGVLWHVKDAWARRHAPNVTLVHYADLEADLDGQMRRIAARTGCLVDPVSWPAVLDAARFDRMRADHCAVVPNAGGVLKDPAAFFRRGRSGAGREVLDRAGAAQLRRPRARGNSGRVADLAAPP